MGDSLVGLFGVDVERSEDLRVGLRHSDEVIEASDAVVHGRLPRVMHPYAVHVELVLKILLHELNER